MESTKNTPTYYFEDVYRFVKTYNHTYRTFTKRRWANKKITEMFKEFQAYDEAYYDRAIEEGRIRVNKKPATKDYVLKENDSIEHDAIRIEPPIYNAPLDIIYENENVLVINKPPSVPVHVCGSYFFNSIVHLMKYGYNYPAIFCVHRLDKLTSGILILAKSQDYAIQFQGTLKKNEIGKMYLARVLGDFPSKIGEEFVVEKSIYCVCPKAGKYEVAKTEEEEHKAKTAKTVFKKVWYDEASNSSLVECYPVTGRTHQIRVHCKSVGCSIINDVPYGGVYIGNPYRDILLPKLGLDKDAECEAEGEKKLEDYEPKIVKKVKLDSTNKEEKEGDSEEQKQPADGEENKPKKEEGEEINDEEQTYVMEIWLHSLRYQYNEQVFETARPYWSNQDVKFEIKEFRKTPSWSHK